MVRVRHLACLFCLTAHFAVCADSASPLIQKGKAELKDNHFTEAAQAFQNALDIDPSSAEAHLGLGTALARQLVSGQVRPAADSDVLERAENHLRQASDLAPSSPRALLELSSLEAALAERETDASARSERYGTARETLKRVLSLQPGTAESYAHLATLERDEFGPPLQQVRAKFAKTRGPIPDAELRHGLQQQYVALVEDAIQNTKAANQMSSRSNRTLLLMARLLRDRALLRETMDEYTADMNAAEDWQRQFLIAGGHLDLRDSGASPQ